MRIKLTNSKRQEKVTTLSKELSKYRITQIGLSMEDL